MQIIFKQWTCEVWVSQYQNGRPAIQLLDAMTGAPVARATVNFPDMKMAPNEVAIKDWAENEGMLDTLVAAGLVEPTGRAVLSGHVAAPICRVLKPELLAIH